MFDPDFDPLKTLKDHDEWIAQMAEHMQSLAQAGAGQAHNVEQNARMVRQLVRGYEHINQKLRYLEERIYHLENPNAESSPT